jgi:hypothetical protein
MEASTAPGIALLFVVYAVGLVWAPALQLASRFAVFATALTQSLRA